MDRAVKKALGNARRIIHEGEAYVALNDVKRALGDAEEVAEAPPMLNAVAEAVGLPNEFLRKPGSEAAAGKPDFEDEEAPVLGDESFDAARIAEGRKGGADKPSLP